MDTKV